MDSKFKGLYEITSKLIMDNKKCINQITDLNLACRDCPFGHLNSSLLFTCSIYEYKKAYRDIQERTKVLVDTFKNINFEFTRGDINA